MKKEPILVIAAMTLLLLSCEKSADSVSPDYSKISASAATASVSSETVKDSTKTKDSCNGKSMPQGMPPKPEEIMKQLDLNQDQLISKDEVKGPLANDFDKVDANHDHVISLDELKSACPPPPPSGKEK